MFKKAKTFTRDFFSTLKDSRESVRVSRRFNSEVDSFVVKAKYFTVFWQSLGVIGAFSFFGFLIQKASEGLLKPGVIQMHHVYIYVSIFLLVSIALLYLKESLELRGEMWSYKLNQKFDDIKIKKMATLDVGRISDPEFIELHKMFSSYRGITAVKDIWKTQADLFGAILGICISVGVLSIVDPVIILVMLFPVVPDLVKTIIVNNRLRELDRKQIISERRQYEYEYCINHKGMSVQTKLFGFTRYYLSRFFHFRDKCMNEKMEHETFERKVSTRVGILQKISTSIVLVYLGYGIVSGNLDLFKIMVIYGSVRTFTWKCRDFSDELGNLSSQHVDFQYYIEFMNIQPLIDESQSCEVTFDRAPDIVLDNVQFAYPRQEGRLALNGCNLTVRSGEKVALIGHNGSGKTTVLRMCSKTYIPNSGSVTFDGKDVRDILQTSLHRQLLCVTQDTGVPDFPINESVAGTSPDKIDLFRLMRAASIAGSDTFIDHLPDGFNTQIGEEWPGGVGFSAGQLQRIKLTAALYRSLDPDTRVVLFDEPMSHCDPETRKRFYGSLKEFVDKTIVVVAHDMDCLPYFDRLVVMHDGKVVDEITGPEAIEQYRDEVALRLASEF